MDFGIDISQKTMWIVCLFTMGYFLMITLFGVYFSRFSSNINDFFYSGQRFAWWLPFMSMVATGIGSYSYLKYSQQGFNTGMSSTMVYLNDWFIFPLFFLGWLPIIYFSRLKSIPEYFEKRFNKTSRYIAVVIILAYMFYYIGYNLFTIGVALQGMFGLSPVISLPFITLLLGLYVTMGGQTAVIFTDLVQGLLLYLAGFLAFGYGLYALGGMDDFWSYLPMTHRNPFPPFRSDPYFNSVGLFWGDALAGGVAFLFLNQGFLMRFLSVRSLNEARFAGVCNILITLPLSAITVGAMGWVAKSIVTKQKALGGALEGYDFLEVQDSFHTFVVVVWQVIQHSPIILGIVLSALLAALMSTIDTLINASSAIGVYDIYKPLFKSRASEKHYLVVARITSIFATVIGLLLAAWFFHQRGTLMSIHYKGIMMLIPSIVSTLILGILWKRFNGTAACCALIVGGGMSFLTLFFPEWIDPLKDFAYGSSTGEPIYFRAFFGMLVTLIVGVVVTLFTKPSPEEKIRGYTIGTIDHAMRKFKNGEPNLKKGKDVKNLKISLDNSIPLGEIVISESAGKKLKANIQDIIYTADSRWYLGGLRSGHLRLSSFHKEGKDIVKLSRNTLNKAYLYPDRSVFLKKIL